MTESNEDGFGPGSQRPSKSQVKRESEALQRLAAELVELPREQVELLALPDQLLDAVSAGGAIRQHGARKRHIKFIGGLLRHLDAKAIREGLGRLRSQNAHWTREHHRVERWRDSLLDEGDGALGALLEGYPGADRQHIRQLVRSAQQEKEQGRPPKSARLLFKYLRNLFGSET